MEKYKEKFNIYTSCTQNGYIDCYFHLFITDERLKRQNGGKILIGTQYSTIRCDQITQLFIKQLAKNDDEISKLFAGAASNPIRYRQ